MLIHTSTRDYGIIEVDVIIGEKKRKLYTYYLSSNYAYNLFLSYYRKGLSGKAIQTLNKFNRRDKWND